MAFAMDLSWSRRIFLRFLLGAHMENLLRGNFQAFESWQRVPRIVLYDALKSAGTQGLGEENAYNHEQVLCRVG